jgi:hypothetical protein
MNTLLQAIIPASEKANAMSEQRRQLKEKAYQSLVDLFTTNDISYIDIASYDDCFYVDVTNYSGEAKRTVNITSIEYNKKYNMLSFYDEEGDEYSDNDLITDEVVIYQEAVNCLMAKYEGYEKLRKGTQVRWIDPAIEDYDPEDREEVLNRIFTIHDIPEGEIFNDTIIGISNEESEAEVYAYELVLAE